MSLAIIMAGDNGRVIKLTKIILSTDQELLSFEPLFVYPNILKNCTNRNQIEMKKIT
jgi:hypothetical protein